MVEYNSELHTCCFTFLEKDEARRLLEFMQRVSFSGGTTIFRKGDMADCVYFVQNGQVAVQNKTGFGDRMQVVALLDPGAPVGEKGVLGPRARGATLVAVEDSSLLTLSQEAFNTLAEVSPVLAIKLLKFLLNRVSLRLEKSSERLTHVL